jgi:UDP-N-acetylglucosamine transferase subunit ALG13
MTIRLNIKRIAFVGLVLMLFSFMLATIFKFCQLSQVIQQPQRDVAITMSIIFIAAVGCLLCLLAVVLSSINSVKEIIDEQYQERMDENQTALAGEIISMVKNHQGSGNALFKILTEFHLTKKKNNN